MSPSLAGSILQPLPHSGELWVRSFEGVRGVAASADRHLGSGKYIQVTLTVGALESTGSPSKQCNEKYCTKPKALEFSLLKSLRHVCPQRRKWTSRQPGRSDIRPTYSATYVLTACWPKWHDIAAANPRQCVLMTTGDNG